MKKYVLLYGNKKKEDNICLLNMFPENKDIKLGLTSIDIKHDVKIIEELVNGGFQEVIFAGLEIGWDKVIENVRKEYPKLLIKVICTTQESLLYYEYERENFFKLLELSKNEVIDEIAFLRKGQYEVYKGLGYKCCFLRENYILDKRVKTSKRSGKKISLGFYPLSYVWNKNIFNQLCVGKMLDNAVISYNNLDERMKDFLDTMNIESEEVKIESISDEELIRVIAKNDVVISTSFTEYFHPVFFIAMELGVPCLIGNNTEFFEHEDKLKEYIITNAEDNAIINAELIKKILDNKDKVRELYKKWKEKYNKLALKSIQDFIG